MKYNVQTLRDAGLEARWTRTQAGAPIIVARNPNGQLRHQRETWWNVTNDLWERSKVIGLVEAFNEHTTLGDIFSIPA